MYSRTLTAMTLAGFAAFAAIPLAQAQPSTVIIAPSAPPPLRVETIPPPPGPRVMTWQPGRWAWTDGNWQWIEGRYVEAPRPNAVWEPGHWAQYASGGFTWVEGRWEH